MSRPLCGAVFGCGMIAELHLRGWARVPDVTIVALGDRDPVAAERRRALAPSARVHDDLGRMLRDERPDFVDILTPPAAHAEHCRIAREHGVHVICQKPLTDDLATARSLLRDFDGDPRLFAVHENHRFRPWFQEILRRHRDGFFGELSLVRLEHLEPAAPAEAYKVEAWRGILLEYGSHLVDMLRALLGEPTRVYARAHRVNARVAGESLVEAMFEYSRGHAQATGGIGIGWKPGGLRRSSALVVGDRAEASFEGTLTRGTPGESSRLRLVRGDEVVLDETRSPSDDYVESFFLLQQEYARAMRTGAPVTQTAAEGYRTLRAVFAAYASIDERRIVDLVAEREST